jgi:hypothetical protein
VTDVKELERTVARLERAMDDAYSRYAPTAEEERIAGITTALRTAVLSVPGPLRAISLELLADRCEPASSARADPSASAELVLLRAEVEQLRAQAVARDKRAGQAVLEALIGADRAIAFGDDEPDSARIGEAVRLLTNFALDLAKAFIAATDQKGGADQAVNRLREALRAEVRGEPGVRLATVLDEIRRNIGVELQAFRVACQDGVQEMLRQFDPLLLELQTSKRKGGVRILGLRPFRFRELWEALQQRRTEMATDEDLYQTFFDGPLRRARERLRQTLGTGRHA